MMNQGNVSPVDVQNYLSGIDYPVERNDIVQAAKQAGADRDVVARLEALEDREYTSPTDVSQALGG